MIWGQTADEKVGTKTVYILCVGTQERKIQQQGKVDGQGKLSQSSKNEGENDEVLQCKMGIEAVRQ